MNVKFESDCVYPDDVAAGRMATKHLLERGHRKIAYGELAITAHYSHTDRLEGYRQAMQAAGLEPVVLKPTVQAQRERLAMAKSILGEIDRPTAIVTPSPGSSSPFAAATLAHGVEIGQDIAFITVNPKVDFHFGVEMSTVIIPFPQVGRISVERLLARMDDPTEACPAIAVAPSIEVGRTT